MLTECWSDTQLNLFGSWWVICRFKPKVPWRQQSKRKTVFRCHSVNGWFTDPACYNYLNTRLVPNSDLPCSMTQKLPEQWRLREVVCRRMKARDTRWWGSRGPWTRSSSSTRPSTPAGVETLRSQRWRTRRRKMKFVFQIFQVFFVPSC